MASRSRSRSSTPNPPRTTSTPSFHIPPLRSQTHEYNPSQSLQRPGVHSVAPLITPLHSSRPPTDEVSPIASTSSATEAEPDVHGTKRRRMQQPEKKSSPAAGGSSASDFSSQEGDERESGTGRTQEPSSSIIVVPPKKRTRTLTTPHQSAVLHSLLAQSRFPTTAMREEVGRAIGLSARKVQVWFQNQRQKAKRPSHNQSVPRPPDLAHLEPLPDMATSQTSPEEPSMREVPGQFVSYESPETSYPSPLAMIESPYHYRNPTSGVTPESHDRPFIQAPDYSPSFRRHMAPSSQLSGPGMPGPSSGFRVYRLSHEHEEPLRFPPPQPPALPPPYRGPSYIDYAGLQNPSSSRSSASHFRASQSSAVISSSSEVGSGNLITLPPLQLEPSRSYSLPGMSSSSPSYFHDDSPFPGTRAPVSAPSDVTEFEARRVVPSSLPQRDPYRPMSHRQRPYPLMTLEPQPQWEEPAPGSFSESGPSSMRLRPPRQSTPNPTRGSVLTDPDRFTSSMSLRQRSLSPALSHNDGVGRESEIDTGATTPTRSPTQTSARLRTNRYDPVRSIRDRYSDDQH